MIKNTYKKIRFFLSLKKNLIIKTTIFGLILSSVIITVVISELSKKSNSIINCKGVLYYKDDNNQYRKLGL